MLSLRNGAYAYQAMHKINFPDVTLQAGECVGLYGASGCGKSTLAQVLAGFITHSQGVMVVPNKSAKMPNPVQWVSQSPEFAFNPRWRLHRSLAESFHVSDELLARYQINPEWLQRMPGQLSGGELQRLNIVRALAPSTQYLLCDEITAQLDSITQQQIWQTLIADIKRRQIGALIISHNFSLLENLCERIIEW